MKADFKTNVIYKCPFCGGLKTEEELKKHLEVREHAKAYSGVWYKWSNLGLVPYQMTMFKLDDFLGCAGDLYEISVLRPTEIDPGSAYSRWDASTEDIVKIMDEAKQKGLCVEPATEDEVLVMLKSCQNIIRDMETASIKDTFKEKGKKEMEGGEE